ncbi:unnamed protein product [Ilex paraguariensis]|uniref:malate dehydrogenase n=1 Tax=Ilex paraguariensis TaxID=185542 RepID=A0ABC8S086_9AQUA
MQSSADANQRIARISAHLNPPNPQMEGSFRLERKNCRAKGGSLGFKVAILGAAGGIGQPLAMLMKMNPLVSVLHLYDVVNTPGVTADISHMDTGAVVRGFLGQQQLEDALTGMDLVIIPAGVPRKPGMTRDDLFKINAGIVKTLCEGVAKCCPNAIVNLISNPVNSTVPITAEVFKKAGTYDPRRLLGVTMLDVVRANTFVVRGFLGQQQLEDALTGMDLVIIPAGVPRKPGMTRDDLFKINAGIVKTLCEGVAKCCPNAIVNLISNPVNSTVPITAEVFKKAGTYDPRRLLGVTMLDVVRANTFVAEVLGLDPREVDVPVVGGHAGVTILPLLSQVKPPCSFTSEETDCLTSRIQNGGTEVVEAKAGSGSATLSMAYAAVKFADACLRGLRGDAGIVQCAFVASQVTELPYFASKVRLGRNGVEEICPLGPLNEYERAGLEKAKKELAASIEKGISFVRK